MRHYKPFTESPISNELIILGVLAFALATALLFLSSCSIQFFEYRLAAMILGAGGIVCLLLGIKASILRR